MMRGFRGLIALAAWTGLGLQLWLKLTSGDFDTAGAALWSFVAFFTLLTNLLVAVVMTVSAVAPHSAAGKRVEGGNVRAAVLLYIAFVGIVYHLLLAQIWDPQGWQLVADVILHTATPVLVFIDWLVFARKDDLRFRVLPLYLIYPIGYAVYALLRGAVDGFYPYPFVDVGQIGYPRALLNIAGLSLAFVLGSALVIGAGRRMAGSGKER